MNGANGRASGHTPTSLKRWSCQDKALPPVSSIKGIHVYDFDNTLFASPLPNKQLWNIPTLGQLGNPDVFIGGGWWHDSGILAATGEGAAKEEPRAWNGWWNEQIVQLVELSMAQKDVVTVLLTGRSEGRFAELLKRMVRSKKLEFDMICLKPEIGPANQKFESTMLFKQDLLRDLVYTYKEADELRIYEDRVKHVKAFRDFFFALNKSLMAPASSVSRKPFNADVIQVAENATTLDPISEVAEIQRMINSHNQAVKVRNAPSGTLSLQIRRTVFYTAYLIPQLATDKLLTLMDIQGNSENDIRPLANSILIAPRPASKEIMQKVGGIGKKVTWRVTGCSVFENKLWAARVEPVSETIKNIHSENSTPTVVLALRRGARPADASRIQNWRPVPDDKAFEFESTVGEKVLLRIEKENTHENARESSFPYTKNSKRNHHRDEDFISLNATQPPSQSRHPQHHWPQRAPEERRSGGISGNYRGGNQHRARGDRRGARGRGTGNNRGRGRGTTSYRSLDDVGESGHGANQGYPSYDDY